MAWECNECGCWVEDDLNRGGCPVCAHPTIADNAAPEEVWRVRWFDVGFESKPRGVPDRVEELAR